ncbi:unnamed protein product, partial [Ectocarpus sp. 8 AP-2014]
RADRVDVLRVSRLVQREYRCSLRRPRHGTPPFLPPVWVWAVDRGMSAPASLPSPGCECDRIP